MIVEQDSPVQELIRQIPKIQKILDYEFKEEAYLIRSLVTVSFTTDFQGMGHSFHQEPYATLGDSVLDVLLLEIAIQNGVERKEQANSYKEIYGNGSHLKQVAIDHAIQNYVLWGKTQYQQEQWKKSPKLLANTIEAILGVAYLDGGMDAARSIFKELGIYQL